ncbi:hypothetical protein [Shewanella surugensis]|uniref:Uncharacterized protein n=1 Tax=Shewanella surugensis TaxID=212020 RepID=A0ABT0L946_9GAMM|nr:hypothetical protein [Shewanella surugensis]MCL1124219.1 hypothetical protein [Shewanella surugensis]
MRKNINELKAKLVATYLSKGVQPSDLSDALFEKGYVDSSIKRTDDSVLVTLSFIDDFDTIKKAKHTMRYTYDLNRYLQKIEQKIKGRSFKVQFCREEAINSILRDLLAAGCSLSALESLPPELKGRYQQYFVSAA